MEVLYKVCRLSNCGATLLCSSSLEDTKLASERFNEAMTIAASFQEEGTDGDHLPRHQTLGISDLCLYSTVPIQAHESDSFYFFDQAMYVKPAVFAGQTEGDVPRILRFCAFVLLMNSALTLYKMGYACLGNRQAADAERFFHKSLLLYSKAITLLRQNNSSIKNSKAMIFFVLAAQNNYMCLCMRLGLFEKAKAAHAAIKALFEQRGHFLSEYSMPWVGEIMLNTAVLTMTDLFTKLPAPAA